MPIDKSPPNLVPRAFFEFVGNEGSGNCWSRAQQILQDSGSIWILIKIRIILHGGGLLSLLSTIVVVFIMKYGGRLLIIFFNFQQENHLVKNGNSHNLFLLKVSV